ncbi:nuclear transport factor 2 family protein [Rurimicrobium arvi]|uniref:Nuclear transport factor 2 family protein n=1 Tax=Rurimicrobium arvi TaxID=2049916 RepID=A0ABP8MJM2_9BACT
METTQNERIAREWFAAFNRQDLEGLLALYDDAAEHFSPKLKIRQPETLGLISGKDALRRWWADAFERLPELHYEPVAFTSDTDRIFMEYIRSVPGEPDMKVAEVLEIQNGRIVASRVYHG